MCDGTYDISIINVLYKDYNYYKLIINYIKQLFMK